MCVRNKPLLSVFEKNYQPAFLFMKPHGDGAVNEESSACRLVPFSGQQLLLEITSQDTVESNLSHITNTAIIPEMVKRIKLSLHG